MIQKSNRLAREFADLAVVRAALSERQLYEVMVDFWTNHFNVYAAKGADRFLIPEYVERGIRPRALRRFRGPLAAPPGRAAPRSPLSRLTRLPEAPPRDALGTPTR